jgi:hypothetical protein
LSTGPERRHGGGLNFHGFAGARIASNTGRAAALLEDAEAGNGDSVTLVYRAHDGVDDVFDRLGGFPTIGVQLFL